ncbi:2Fe-2S iron-sulfur cluster-binding protein [Pseudomonas sp. LRF_L74]|uniref:2Fe-2S iron-sulfur cluster-binding protein n=1 Tax=Pseudomonas sp. LRF_L74 TaxID=3369422 RepID=UPI003F5DED84
MEHDVLIEDTGEHFLCRDSESVLNGMARLCRKGIPVGCRGGGCGICKVRVTAGEHRCRAMSKAHVSDTERACGVALACCIEACSDLRLQVLGKMQRAVCRSAADAASVRKSN